MTTIGAEGRSEYASTSAAPPLRAVTARAGRNAILFIAVAGMNFASWLWAFIAFHDQPVLLGVALVIYGLGLRHAVDADHIAAIDNVTRKLMHEGQKPVAAGFFFALGHSSIVIAVTAAVAGLAAALSKFEDLQEIGGVISTIVSALFLIAIGAMNLVIFLAIYKDYRRVRCGGDYSEEDFDLLLNNRGLLSRLLRPLFKLITRSWHMFPLGLLFGLSFDTATEIAMFGVSAAQAAKGTPLVSIMAFPALFTAGMSLVDTADGVLMIGAYRWARIKPIRKLYYNMTITLISVVVALVIGGIEILGLVCDTFGLKGRIWDFLGSLDDHMNIVGFGLIALFAASWLGSWIVYRAKKLDQFEVRGVAVADGDRL